MRHWGHMGRSAGSGRTGTSSRSPASAVSPAGYTAEGSAKAEVKGKQSIPPTLPPPHPESQNPPSVLLPTRDLLLEADPQADRAGYPDFRNIWGHLLT